MHPGVNIFLTAAAFVSVAFGQQAQADRVLHFTSTGTQQDVMEIATVIRSISDIKETSFDAKEDALVLHGTASQIALAEWLFPLLDLPTSDRAVAQQRDKATKHEYQVAANDVLRVFYLSNPASVQSFQELATAVRALLDIPRLTTYSALKAIVVRGSAEQAAAAEFVINEMDKPAISTDFSSAISHKHSPKFGMRIMDDNIVRVFYLPNTKTVMDFQLLSIIVRVATDIRWMFTYNAARAVAARGSDERLALAEWLFNELDQPANTPQESGPHEYRITNASDDVIRIFRLAPPVSSARLDEISNRIRPITLRRLALPYPPNNAIVVRATVGQIAVAEQFIKEQ